MNRKVTIEELRVAHRRAASLTLADADFGPIFDRLDAELIAAETQNEDPLLARAREVLRAVL